MSVVIGYWSGGTGVKPQNHRHQLLTRAAAAAGYPEARIISSSTTAGPAQLDDAEAQPSFGFGVAACGSHAALETNKGDASGEATSVTATLSVAGARTAADAWARVGGDGLLLGREAFGRATLFWTRIDDAIWFSTHLATLLSVRERAEVSLAGFYAYGCFSYIPAPLSPVCGVQAVPAGSEAVWSSAAPTGLPQLISRHEWREPEAQISDERAAIATLRRLLEESVATQVERLRGEPVGLYLSGGLDSALTAALLVRAGISLRAYTLDFGPGCFSEMQYAELVARRLGIPLTKVPVTTRRVRAMLAPTAARLDGLYGDGVTIPLALLCERARTDVRVVFNGEGGDQLFAGWTNKPMIAASVYGRAAGEMLGANPSPVEETFRTQYMRTFHRLHGYEAAVYTEAVRRQMAGLDVSALLDAALDPTQTRGLLHRLRRANLMLKGADNIQPRATNLALGYGLDLRTIFCSIPLAEWSFAVSGELWLREGCEKYLLKRAVEGLLPAEVVWREKRGMGVPLTLWLTKGLRRWAGRQLRPRVLEEEGLWRADAPRRILNGELSGQIQGRRIGETLWLLLMWRGWRERVLDACAQRAREERRAFRWSAVPPLRALKRRHA
jgi:asparagine synthase (glutamine-hydrolysing)